MHAETLRQAQQAQQAHSLWRLVARRAAEVGLTRVAWPGDSRRALQVPHRQRRSVIGQGAEANIMTVPHPIDAQRRAQPKEQDP